MDNICGGSRPNRFDMDLLEMALAWLPYGHADEDATIAAFGLAVDDFHIRVLAILDHYELREIPERTKARLRLAAKQAL
jgi:hypothetical protein